MALEFLAAEDPQVTDCLRQELARQRGSVELIASENFTSRAVMEAVGSVLTNKYAEGYPGKRYYGGCEYVDVVEDLARDRAKRAVRRRARQRAAPFRRAGEHRPYTFALLEPGRHACWA